MEEDDHSKLPAANAIYDVGRMLKNYVSLFELGISMKIHHFFSIESQIERLQEK